VPASGTFVGDSGRSIFLEQHVEQRGRRNYFRWEIPYRCIHRVEETAVVAIEVAAPREEPPLSRAAAAGAGDSTDSTVLPFPSRPKTA